jgi:hypothetical protein
MRFASNGFHSQEARGTCFLQNIENQCCHCDYWLHWWIGLRLFMKFAQDATWWFSPLHRMTTNKRCFTRWGLPSDGFHSQKARGTFFLPNIENQCCHCDYRLHWWIELRLLMEFAQDATWWFSPLHRMTTNKRCFTRWGLPSNGFHSQKARGTCFLQNIENQCCHCDYGLHWWIWLR